MRYDTITLDVAQGIATITLNRPEAYNALSLALARELFNAVLAVDEDPAVRCVVVTGAGKAFCGGGDVKDFTQSLPTIGALLKELTTYIHGAVSRLVRTPKPVISVGTCARPPLCCPALKSTWTHGMLFGTKRDRNRAPRMWSPADSVLHCLTSATSLFRSSS